MANSQNNDNLFHQVAFYQLNSILIEDSTISSDDQKINRPILATFIHELNNFGFSIEKEVYERLLLLKHEYLEQITKKYIALIKESLGDHVKHKPFYPNFPKQVMKMNDVELFLNAFFHYLTLGEWKPDFCIEERLKLRDFNKLKMLKLVDSQSLKDFYFLCLQSNNTTIPLIEEFIKAGTYNDWISQYNGDIPFKKTLCTIAGIQLEKGRTISNLVKTSTDVLRIMAFLSNSDISLKDYVLFNSLKRKTRKILVNALNNVINIDDIKKYKSLWKIAFHNLHIGEYKGKASEIAQIYRNESNVVTLETGIYENIKHRKMGLAARDLVLKPSVFARNLDKLLRDSRSPNEQQRVLKLFKKVLPKITSKILIQLLGFLKGRNNDEKRYILTSGKRTEMIILEPKQKLSEEIVQDLISTIKSQLIKNFSNKKQFKDNSKIFIDPIVKNALPVNQANTITANSNIVGRGSVFDFGEEDQDKNFIRLFTYWKNNEEENMIDIDLSAMFFNHNFSHGEYISYHFLKSNYATHSGDVRNAPNGASEFIDINIKKAIKNGFRWVVLDNRVYTGNTFKSLKTCFTGYMLRNKQMTGEIFEPKTVKQKFDLNVRSNQCLSMVFDLVNRQFIYIDLKSSINNILISNSIAYNKENIAETLNCVLNTKNHKLTIFEILEMHVVASDCNITEDRYEADYTIGYGDDFDFNLYNFTEFNSRFI